MKRLITLFALFCTALLCQQQFVWISLADISGSGAAVALGTGNVRACQLVAPSTNVSNVRWGDSSISATQGAIIAPGGGQYLQTGNFFSLASTFVFIANGDKLSVSCAR
jgi:hypothetical protein